MSVQIAATLDEPTVAALLRDLTPLMIGLGDADQPNRWMEIQWPDRVAFVPGEGLRIDTTAKLSWTVAGVSIAFTIQALTILLRPVIDVAVQRLNLVATIEQADLKNVPDIIDRTIVSHVNERLAAQPDALGWTFGKTLAVRLAMPDSMAPLEAYEMKAEDAAIEVGIDHLRFSLALAMRFTRSEEPRTA
jgi:hypothetical protein